MIFENQFEGISEQDRTVLLASNTTDSTLLITGNTGTGKSHLAEVVHQWSASRRNSKFHKINLATLSETLIESELFGHERGAFTGAEGRRIGRLECCAGGTVFLDEIGELSPRLQAKLLDFIQYKRVSPVGSNRDIDIDVRIIAATNRNLEQAVEQGAFRADLYHRLRVFHVHLRDLKDNPGAALLFARKILHNMNEKVRGRRLSFTPEAEAAIASYDWPGNLRELSNAIEYAVAMEAGTTIQLRSLPRELQRAMTKRRVETTSVTCSKSEGGPLGVIELPLHFDYHQTKESFERLYLERALRVCGGQINLTSRRTGLNKVSLTKKIKRYSIDWKTLKTSAAERSRMQ